MKKFIDNLSCENFFSFYSSFFRIFICFHLLKKIVLTWEYKELIYTSDSFYVHDQSGLFDLFNINQMSLRDNFVLLYFVYFILILFYFFGLGKYLTAVLLYVFFEFFQNLCPVLLNGGDNLLKFIMLYMIFIDSYGYFKMKPLVIKNKSIDSFKNFLSNIFGYSICVHLCVVYFISAIHKIHADVWFNGIATYYTLSLERFRGTSYNLELAKNGVFVTISTYGTIFIELLYPILIWFKKTKIVMILLALILHISIYVLMMIYDFQLIFIFVQGFFINNCYWIKFYNNTKLKINELKRRFIKAYDIH